MKITKNQEEQILTVLRGWPEERLTWAALRERIQLSRIVVGSDPWSRQALSARPRIKAAYALAKQRIREHVKPNPSADKAQVTVDELRMKLAELEQMYEGLLLRHAQLVYNASLLDGGVQLLDMPLPDNTKSQRG